MSEIPLNEKLDHVWRYVLAHALTLYLLLMGLISFSLPFAWQAKPYFLLMPIYYWAIYRPTLLPPMLIFALGVVTDLILHSPQVGVTAILYLAAQWIVRGQRVYFMGQPFIMIWLGFCLTALGFGFAQYALFSILSFNVPALSPILVSIVMSIFLFPFVAFILNHLHKLLPATGKLV